MKVTVTQEDIDKGKPLSCTSCPIALALIRQGHDVEVSADLVSFHRPGTSSVFRPLPRSARQFIHNFDFDTEVEPFTFEIDET